MFFFQVLYSRIAVALWKSSRGLERIPQKMNACATNSNSSVNCHLIRKPSSRKYEKRALGITESQVKKKKFVNRN